MFLKSIIVIFAFVAGMVLISLCFAGTLIDDFEDGDTEGWQRSPQNEKSKVFWGIEDRAIKFDPKGLPWDQAISQMNFVGNQRVKNVSEWKDYDLEVDLKHVERANWPGGIRARVDLDTGGHYAVWLYPGDSKMNLYKNPGWDINAGLQTLGQAAYKPDVDKFHTLKISCQGPTIKVFYDGEEAITAEDKEHEKGTIALCVQDKVVYFDNVKVTGPDIPSIDMSPVEPVGKIACAWGKIKK